MSINRVTITGNLTRDPEVKQTGGGMSVMKLGVAVNDRRKVPNSNEWEDVPNFIDCTMFGDRAAKVAQYLNKGSKVAISGRLRQETWETQDGQKRSRVGVVIDDLEFMSRSQQQPQAQQPQYQQPSAYDLAAEDIPF